MAIFMVACGEDDTDPTPVVEAAKVNVVAGDATQTTITFTINSSNATEVAYKVFEKGAAVSVDDVRAGTTVEANKVVSVTVENLTAETSYDIYAAAANEAKEWTLSAKAEMTTKKGGEEPTPTPGDMEEIVIDFNRAKLFKGEGVMEGAHSIFSATAEDGTNMMLLMFSADEHFAGPYYLAPSSEEAAAIKGGSPVNFVMASADTYILYDGGAKYEEFACDGSSFINFTTEMPTADNNTIKGELVTADKTKKFIFNFTSPLYDLVAPDGYIHIDANRQLTGLNQFVHEYIDGKHHLTFDSLAYGGKLILVDPDNDGVLGAGETLDRGYEMYTIEDGTFVADGSYYAETLGGDMIYTFNSGSIAIKANGQDEQGRDIYTVAIGNLKGDCLTVDEDSNNVWMHITYGPESPWTMTCVGRNGIEDENLNIKNHIFTANADGTHKFKFYQQNGATLIFNKVHGYTEGAAQKFFVASSLEAAQRVAGSAVTCWIDCNDVEFMTRENMYYTLLGDREDAYLEYTAEGEWQYKGWSTTGDKRFVFTYKPEVQEEKVYNLPINTMEVIEQGDGYNIINFRQTNDLSHNFKLCIVGGLEDGEYPLTEIYIGKTKYVDLARSVIRYGANLYDKIRQEDPQNKLVISSDNNSITYSFSVRTIDNKRYDFTYTTEKVNAEAINFVPVTGVATPSTEADFAWRVELTDAEGRKVVVTIRQPGLGAVATSYPWGGSYYVQTVWGGSKHIIYPDYSYFEIDGKQYKFLADNDNYFFKLGTEYTDNNNQSIQINLLTAGSEYFITCSGVTLDLIEGDDPSAEE